MARLDGGGDRDGRAAERRWCDARNGALAAGHGRQERLVFLYGLGDGFQ